MITVKAKGDFKRTRSFLERTLNVFKLGELDKYGRMGVEALASATPSDTGKTAKSWDYEIVRNKNGVSIVWTNSNINENVPIAIILQYGHATGWGSYVKGIDYINPAMKPVFDKIAKGVWEEVVG